MKLTHYACTFVIWDIRCFKILLIEAQHMFRRCFCFFQDLSLDMLISVMFIKKRVCTNGIARWRVWTKVWKSTRRETKFQNVWRFIDVLATRDNNTFPKFLPEFLNSVKMFKMTLWQPKFLIFLFWNPYRNFHTHSHKQDTSFTKRIITENKLL